MAEDLPSACAAEDDGAPKPLFMGNGQGEEQIVSTSAHPMQDILAVGDIAGKLTVYYI